MKWALARKELNPEEYEEYTTSHLLKEESLLCAWEGGFHFDKDNLIAAAGMGHLRVVRLAVRDSLHFDHLMLFNVAWEKYQFHVAEYLLDSFKYPLRSAVSDQAIKHDDVVMWKWLSEHNYVRKICNYIMAHKIPRVARLIRTFCPNGCSNCRAVYERVKRKREGE